MALWSGRFAGGPAAQMQAFSESLSTDLLMWREDITGSKAHATMLAAMPVGTIIAGVLSDILSIRIVMAGFASVLLLLAVVMARRGAGFRSLDDHAQVAANR